MGELSCCRRARECGRGRGTYGGNPQNEETKSAVDTIVGLGLNEDVIAVVMRARWPVVSEPALLASVGRMRGEMR